MILLTESNRVFTAGQTGLFPYMQLIPYTLTGLIRQKENARLCARMLNFKALGQKRLKVEFCDFKNIAPLPLLDARWAIKAIIHFSLFWPANDPLS